METCARLYKSQKSENSKIEIAENMSAHANPAYSPRLRRCKIGSRKVTLDHIERVVKIYKKTLNVPTLYTTAEAAKLIGISRQTLQSWIMAGRIKAPELLRPFRLRLWTSEDVAQLKQLKRKQFRRKPGRRPGQKSTPRGEVSAST